MTFAELISTIVSSSLAEVPRWSRRGDISEGRHLTRDLDLECTKTAHDGIGALLEITVDQVFRQVGLCQAGLKDKASPS